MTTTKKILVLAPVLAWHEQTQDIRNMLSFLEEYHYQLDIIDPLLTLSVLDNERYYQAVQDQLSPILDNYDAFIGFSFGAVILKHCFKLLEHESLQRKPVVLFSAPAFADEPLKERLGAVVALAQQLKLESAHALLMQQVFHPNSLPDLKHSCDNPELACARLVEGLTRVLTTDSRSILLRTSVVHHHFIGEHSYLVNRSNVIAPKHGALFIVPNAGMRVLQNNAAYCQKKLLEILV